MNTCKRLALSYYLVGVWVHRLGPGAGAGISSNCATLQIQADVL